MTPCHFHRRGCSIHAAAEISPPSLDLFPHSAGAERREAPAVAAAAIVGRHRFVSVEPEGGQQHCPRQHSFPQTPWLLFYVIVPSALLYVVWAGYHHIAPCKSRIIMAYLSPSPPRRHHACHVHIVCMGLIFFRFNSLRAAKGCHSGAQSITRLFEKAFESQRTAVRTISCSFSV